MTEIELALKNHHRETVIKALEEVHDVVLNRALEHKFDPKYCTGIYDAAEAIKRLIQEKEGVANVG